MLLEKICAIQSGLTVKARLAVSLEGVKVIRLQDIQFDGTIDVNRLETVSLPEVPERYIARAGDIVFRSRGASNMARVLPEDFSSFAVAVMPVVILRTRHPNVLPEYIAWAINSPSSQDYFRSVSRDSTISMIPRAALTNFEVDLPDIDTQRLIAQTADLIERRRHLQIKLSRLQRKSQHLILSEIARSRGQLTKRNEYD